MIALESSTAWADVATIAFHKEKIAAKRLAARTGISENEALHQILCAIAQPRSIAELVAERQHALALQVARSNLRMQQRADALQCKRALRWPSAAHWQAWFDGSASPNPGRIGVGAVLCSPQGVITDISRSGGAGDSNDAEYLALIAVLQAAVTRGVTAMRVHGDSRIVIEDVTGVHRVAMLADHRHQAQLLLNHIGDVTFKWIPRAKNGRADNLARLGL